MAATLRNGLPLLTIDMDGVICQPPFNRNLGIHRAFLDPDAPPPAARVPARWFKRIVDPVRFELRRPLPGAREALAELRALRTLLLLTGRRSPPDRWLRRHGFTSLLDGVVINETPLRSPHFKLQAIADLGAAEHIDDDGRTVQLLAQRSEAQPYLRDWPRNRGLPLDERVRRVAGLGALAALLRDEGGPRQT